MARRRGTLRDAAKQAKAKADRDGKPRKPSVPKDTIDAARRAEEQAQLDAQAEAAKAGEEEDGHDFAESRKIFFEGPGKSGLEQLNAAGLDQDVAEQVAWLRRTGETPLEFLARCYRNPLVGIKERIAAARGALEYVHRKMPQQVKLQGDPNNPLAANLTVQTARDKLVDRLSRLAQKPAQGAGDKGAGGSKKPRDGAVG